MCQLCILIIRSIIEFITKGNYVFDDVYINSIEGFRGDAKVRFVEFRGVSKNTFYLHLKECEFRFNYR